MPPTRRPRIVPEIRGSTVWSATGGRCKAISGTHHYLLVALRERLILPAGLRDTSTVDPLPLPCEGEDSAPPPGCCHAGLLKSGIPRRNDDRPAPPGARGAGPVWDGPRRRQRGASRRARCRLTAHCPTARRGRTAVARISALVSAAVCRNRANRGRLRARPSAAITAKRHGDSHDNRHVWWHQRRSACTAAQRSACVLLTAPRRRSPRRSAAPRRTARRRARARGRSASRAMRRPSRGACRSSACRTPRRPRRGSAARRP